MGELTRRRNHSKGFLVRSYTRADVVESEAYNQRQHLKWATALKEDAYQYRVVNNAECSFEVVESNVSQVSGFEKSTKNAGVHTSGI